MLKTIDRCTKCANICKLQTESNAQLLNCPGFISKRSSKLNTADLRPENSESHTLYRNQNKEGLNRKSPLENELNSQFLLTSN